MAYFYSFISCNGRFFFPNYKVRKEMVTMNLLPEGHPSIVDYYKSKGQLANKNTTEDKCNKYEYNPLLDKLTVSYINGKDNREEAYNVVKALDFSLIEPRLIVKSIEPLGNYQSLLESLICADLNSYNSLRDYIWNNISSSIWNLLITSVNRNKFNNDNEYLAFLYSFINIKEIK